MYDERASGVIENGMVDDISNQATETLSTLVGPGIKASNEP